MDSVEVFGWIVCTLLAVSFIVSLVFLPKQQEQEVKHDNRSRFQKNKLPKTKRKHRSS